MRKLIAMLALIGATTAIIPANSVSAASWTDCEQYGLPGDQTLDYATWVFPDTAKGKCTGIGSLSYMLVGVCKNSSGGLKSMTGQVRTGSGSWSTFTCPVSYPILVTGSQILEVKVWR